MYRLIPLYLTWIVLVNTRPYSSLIPQGTQPMTNVKAYLLATAVLLLSVFALFSTSPVASATLSKNQQLQYNQEVSTYWVQANATKKLSLKQAKSIVNLTYARANKLKLDPTLLLAVMKVESGFNKGATSPAGAVGLMQVMPLYHYKAIGKRNAYREDVSIEVGSKVLKDCYQRTRNNTKAALNCYSGGGGPRYASKVLAYHKSANRYIQPASNAILLAKL